MEVIIHDLLTLITGIFIYIFVQMCVLFTVFVYCILLGSYSVTLTIIGMFV